MQQVAEATQGNKGPAAARWGERDGSKGKLRGTAHLRYRVLSAHAAPAKSKLASLPCSLTQGEPASRDGVRNRSSPFPALEGSKTAPGPLHACGQPATDRQLR
jgi:hypothetical protein